MEVSSSADTALRRIQRARIQLALSHPFLATAATRLPIVSAEGRSWCDTMATDGYFIFYSEQWVLGLSDEEVMGVLAHEILHCVLGHPDRRGTRVMLAWNMATDLAINLILDEQGFALPKGRLLDRKFLFQHAEEIYEKPLPRITTIAVYVGIEKSKVLRGSGKPKKGEGDGSYQQNEPGYKGFDVHLDPDDARGSDLRPEDRPDSEERRLIRQQLIADVREHLPGSVAGRWAEELRLASHKPLDWHLLLRRWLSGRIKSDWRSIPFSKRFIHRGLYLPSVGVEAPGHLVFAIDTSGSMPYQELQRAFAEVLALRSIFPCRLTLIQCDAELQEVVEFEAAEPAEFPENIRVKGRGGTDFRPVFKHVKADDQGGNAVIIYVTDGYGTFPKPPPLNPTVWVATRHAIPDSKFPFGNVVRLS